MKPLLKDDRGRPLPLRMSPETWDDLRSKADLAVNTLDQITGPDPQWFGIDVILHRWMRRGDVLQWREIEDQPEMEYHRRNR